MQSISTLLNGYYTNRKYGRRHIKIQPKPQSLQSLLNAANRFRDKTMYYNIQDTRSGILMFPFQKFQTNKFSSQEVKWSLRGTERLYHCTSWTTACTVYPLRTRVCFLLTSVVWFSQAPKYVMRSEGQGWGGGGVLTNLNVHFLIKTIFPWLMIEITIKSVFYNNNFN